jgi:predicted extracellular nuclease
MNSTRDILYVKGLTLSHDTIHIFVVHAPSRTSGELATRPFRMTVANVVCEAIEQLHEDAKIILVGDFNDYVNSPALKRYESLGLINVSKNAKGRHGVGGTYRYKGYWQSLDHIFMSPSLSERVDTVYINDADFLLEKDDDYGCHRPFRTFNNKRTKRGGFSDHLPLVVRIRKK